MPAVASVREFLAVARKSKQLDNARLDEFLSRNASLPKEPTKLATLLVRRGICTAFQAEQFLRGKYKGFHIGGYRVLERLGAGGAGTVYLAEHQLMKRRAAIKVLPTALANDPAIVDRFRVEAQAAAVLDHPNVVHLYDFSHAGRMYYLVMEYVDGPNLHQLLAGKGPPHFARACEYVRQAAHGLGHAHGMGLVHRDVKPANILLDAAGTIKVLDLGLARIQRADTDSITLQYNSGAVLGTADYLAPEQALNLHDVDHRADVYGLGATLYALLTGLPPFPGGTIGQKLMSHQTKVPDLVDTIRPEIPGRLAQVVARMLEKAPADRQRDMEEVAAELSEWADQAPPSSRPSARSLSDMRLNVSAVGKVTSATGRLLGKSEADTWVTAEQQDTARIPADSKPKVPTLKAARRDAARWGLLVAGILGAVVAGVAGGVVALLLTR